MRAGGPGRAPPIEDRGPWKRAYAKPSSAAVGCGPDTSESTESESRTCQRELELEPPFLRVYQSARARLRRLRISQWRPRQGQGAKAQGDRQSTPTSHRVFQPPTGEEGSSKADKREKLSSAARGSEFSPTGERRRSAPARLGQRCRERFRGASRAEAAARHCRTQWTGSKPRRPHQPSRDGRGGGRHRVPH